MKKMDKLHVIKMANNQLKVVLFWSLDEKTAQVI